MPLDEAQCRQLQEFFNFSDFANRGGVITDLDGTAIHEFKGRLSVPESVKFGLKKIHDLGRPVMINTLRFPLSVMRTFGEEWYAISNAPVPTVLMNGSQLGYMIKADENTFSYEEITAFPLDENEIDEVITIVQSFTDNKVENLLVFYYPKNWQKGEIIWTPVKDKIKGVQKKYLSASLIESFELERLREALKKEEICMIFLLIDIPQDQLMAYQHTKKSNFFTHKGVDKLYGAEQMAEHLQIQLSHCLGAGDTEMDIFLKGVGLAVHVGNPYLNYEGVMPALKIGGSAELGELFFQLAAMQRTVIQ